MSTDPFQAEVTQVALPVAAAHGYALAGGQALMAHGIVIRPTEDIDLFTDIDDAALAAADPVRHALLAAGFDAALIPETTELGDLFDGFNSDMVEFEVSRGAETVRLSLARFSRTTAPVSFDVGPVLHLNDVLGSKVAAMATRAEPRDFVDVAAALRHYPATELLQLAHQSDPALTGTEVAESMRHLDRLPDDIFTQWIPIAAVPGMRQAFGAWPRGAGS